MVRFSTDLYGVIKLLYKNYGGWNALLYSEYIWISMILCGVCWRIIFDYSWVEIAKGILPTLSGFSIAAYAIFFAVLDERARMILQAPDPDLAGQSPLLALASAISHAVVVQISAILYAIAFQSKPIPSVFIDYIIYIVYVLSFIGMLLTIYGVVLILAGIFMIFRILSIQSNMYRK